MAIAPFFSRASDAVRGVADIQPEELANLLENRVIEVKLASGTADSPNYSLGAEILVNLLSRLYPSLALDGPAELVSRCREIATAVNPQVELLIPGATSKRAVSVTYGDAERATDSDISVSAAAWCVAIDQPNPAGAVNSTSFGALGAACLAAAEVFRTVFADHLGVRGRQAPQPGAIDLITSRADLITPIVDIEGVVLPDLHLVGAGAIGQACGLALSTSGARGTLTVVDPQIVELSNLQRYVLSSMEDVGKLKTSIVDRVLSAKGWTVKQVEAEWGKEPHAGPRQSNVLVALDTAQDRLGVAVGLHKRVYNAFTQPDDLGWSRHEEFGQAPCLACLYYPSRQRPSDDELIAIALRQHRLRVLSYFVTGAPVGFPLPLIASSADIPTPGDAPTWLQKSLLEDLIAAGLVAADQANAWLGRTIGHLYAEGICGGAILNFGGRPGDNDVIVPLAHQSVFAGVMLALQPLVSAIPDLLKYRSPSAEGRFDLNAGLPQVVARPRQKTGGCFCSDPDYVKAF